MQKKYIYTGPTIAKERLNGYKEYIRKEKVFEQIKKSIVIKMRSLEVDTNIDRIELEKISKSFPFNDEYYEFDRESLEVYYYIFYLFEYFVSAFFSKDIIEPNSFISDNGYKLLTDFIINNNLLWILMLSDSHSCSFCIPKEVENKIMIAMDSMSSISETKFSNYNFSNLSDILILAVLTECIE